MTIKDGILSVPDEAFAGFSTLKIIKLEEGLKKIGNKSFEYVYSPEVYLPNSLEEIGEDAFWSGYYPYDYSKHLVYARFRVNFSKKTLTKCEHGPIIDGTVSYTHLTHSRRRQKGGGKRFPFSPAHGLRRNLAF